MLNCWRTTLCVVSACTPVHVSASAADVSGFISTHSVLAGVSLCLYVRHIQPTGVIDADSVFNGRHLCATCSAPNTALPMSVCVRGYCVWCFLSVCLWSPEGYPGGYPATAPTYTPNLYQTGSPGYPPGESEHTDTLSHTETHTYDFSKGSILCKTNVF